MCLPDEDIGVRRVQKCSIYAVCFNCGIFFLPLANLTGHTERVGMENFELLKVLGTGGKCLHGV